MSALCKVFMIIYHRFWGFFFFCWCPFFRPTLHPVICLPLPLSYLYTLEDPQTPQRARDVCVYKYLHVGSSFHRDLLYDSYSWLERTQPSFFCSLPPPFVFKAVCVLLRVRVQFVWVCAVLCCAVMLSCSQEENNDWGSRWRAEAPQHCVSSNRCSS